MTKSGMDFQENYTGMSLCPKLLGSSWNKLPRRKSGIHAFVAGRSQTITSGYTTTTSKACSELYHPAP